MKKLFQSILFLLIAITGFAQFNQPAAVIQKLGNDRSFSRYAYEMMSYVKQRQDAFANDAITKRYYERQEKFLARNLLYLENRQDKDGNIFNYAKKTFEEANRYQAPLQPNAVESSYGIWTLVGPTNNVTSTTSDARGQGRVDRMAFHPSDPDVIYAGTPCSGLWRSSTGGLTWGNVSNNISNLGISGIVVSWADANDIYILTGDGDSNLGDFGFVQGFDYIRPSIGVLKSTDGGVTWNKTGDFGITGFYVCYKLVQNPNNANMLIAATSEGLYRTTNGGITWELVSGDTAKYYDVEFKPGSSTLVYAASGNTFYISTNGGASFINQNNNFDVAFGSCTRIAIAVTPANASYVYVFAGYTDGSGNDFNKGVYRSTNSGDAFIQRSTSAFLVSTPAYMHNIAVSPTDVNLVIIGSLDVFKSTNGASTFAQINQRSDANLTNYTHADVHEVTFNPLDGDLYLGTDGGVHKSTDDGTTIQFGYSGFSNTQFYHFDVSESDNTIMLAGAQDNGINRRTGAFTIFNHIANGDGYTCRFNHNTTGPAYFAVNKRVYKTDAGFTTYAQTGAASIPDDWYKTIAISYFNNNIAYTSSGSIYKTTNGGTAWTNMGGRGRWALITCPSNSNRIYASGGDEWNDGGTQLNKKLQRSDDEGDNWTDLQENPGFPETITKITGIAVDPANSNRVWVTMGGFTDGQKVYYSNNAGDSWSNLSGTLPDVPVNCIAIDDNLDAYIGTDIGVFFKTSTMNDWQPYTNFLPRIPVTELHIRGTSIYASTFGRGIWRSDTHTACSAGLSLAGNTSGYKFYEALTISSSATLTGGFNTEVFYKARDYITLTENFRANASTGEKFKAWIANCNSGGIPVFAVITQGQNAVNTNDKGFEFMMPFDGKASVIIINEKGEITGRIADNEIYRKGKNKIAVSELEKIRGTACLFIDGVLTAKINL
jgi:photosystem II stability/assembly factor-like uncharacterized protein